jgi:hypothetical protein
MSQQSVLIGWFEKDLGKKAVIGAVCKDSCFEIVDCVGIVLESEVDARDELIEEVLVVHEVLHGVRPDEEDVVNVSVVVDWFAPVVVGSMEVELFEIQVSQVRSE